MPALHIRLPTTPAVYLPGSGSSDSTYARGSPRNILTHARDCGRGLATTPRWFNLVTEQRSILVSQLRMPHNATVCLGRSSPRFVYPDGGYHYWAATRTQHTPFTSPAGRRCLPVSSHTRQPRYAACDATDSRATRCTVRWHFLLPTVFRTAQRGLPRRSRQLLNCRPLRTRFMTNLTCLHAYRAAPPPQRWFAAG